MGGPCSMPGEDGQQWQHLILTDIKGTLVSVTPGLSAPIFGIQHFGWKIFCGTIKHGELTRQKGGWV